jgi:hypothetical protein
VELYLRSLSMSPWRCASLSKRYIFMAWYLVKHGDNFIDAVSRRISTVPTPDISLITVYVACVCSILPCRLLLTTLSRRI